MDLIATADEVIEQILVQCYLYRAREGDRAGARVAAETTLERLLSRGLAYELRPGADLRLHPYAACNAIRTRKGEPADDAWADWIGTGRRSAMSLPAEAHRYRFTLRREWHAFTAVADRLSILRLPLPLRQLSGVLVDVHVLEPTNGLVERHDSPGRVELRFAPSVQPPVSVLLTVEFTGGEAHDDNGASTALGDASRPEDQLWLRPREGIISESPLVNEVAAQLARRAVNARDFLYQAWTFSNSDGGLMILSYHLPAAPCNEYVNTSEYFFKRG